MKAKRAKLFLYEKKAVREWLGFASDSDRSAQSICPFTGNNRGLRNSPDSICRHPVCRAWFPLVDDEVQCPCYIYDFQEVVDAAKKMVAPPRKVVKK